VEAVGGTITTGSALLEVCLPGRSAVLAG
ncbi:MAG: hypothetical protein QOE84_577, partial [Actinomycetota bacterium]|nr:hypothetical protein [Actinomycetota bacterium]